jgi:hypothetical protein
MESVWDYPRPPRVEPSPARVVVELDGEVLADTRRSLWVLEIARAIRSRPGPRTAPSSRGWSRRGSSQRSATSSPQRIPVRAATKTRARQRGSVSRSSSAHQLLVKPHMSSLARQIVTVQPQAGPRARSRSPSTGY